MHQRSIIIIRTKKGEQSSSLIRGISQILIGSGKVANYQTGELGVRENITSIILFDKIKIGLVGQVDGIKMLKTVVTRFSEDNCRLVILLHDIDDDENAGDLIEYANDNNIRVLEIESSWSKKLGVNYLNNTQHQLILDEIDNLET